MSVPNPLIANGLQLPIDDTASTPSISVGGNLPLKNSGTGIYADAVNVLKMSIAGTEKFTLNSSGLRLAGSLGVGNSAAATTPGSVVKKIEVFDASGVSLGFLPVYNAIT